jgi:hypothetical protein
MSATTHSTLGQDIRHASGEELLLLAVFGSPKLKTRIDRELDRRAVACNAGVGRKAVGWRPTCSAGAA